MKSSTVAIWGVVAPQSPAREQLKAKLLEAAARARIVCLQPIYDSAECYIAADQLLSGSTSQSGAGFTLESGQHGLLLNPEATASVGSRITFDSKSGALILRSDCSGAFPLYFSCDAAKRTFLFSTHQQILADLLGGTPDYIGILQYLRNSYTLNGRTFFREIARLQPRQVVRWSLIESPTLSTSRQGIPEIASELNSVECLEQLWATLCSTASAVDGPLALMMSGGWDSRTLLGSLTAAQKRHPEIHCYSHGDVESRELRLVKQLSELCGAAISGIDPRVSVRTEAIRAQAFHPEALAPYVRQVETALFPHWYAAGRNLHEQSVHTAQSGVFGELLGGHYGRTMLLQGVGKIGALAGELLGRSERSRLMNSNDLASLICGSQPIIPWFVSGEVGAAPNVLYAQYREELQQVVEQYFNDGLRTPDTLLEWFVSEHRGAQYIAAQALSMRPWLKISLPFAEPQIMGLVRRFAFNQRVHNRLNQRLLRRFSPMLLDVPLASSLLPASYPILVLEASRFARSIFDTMQTKLSAASGNFISRPRRTWANYEFLRSGDELSSIHTALKAPFWNRAAMQTVLANVASGRYQTSLHSLAEVLLKMFTVDQLISPN